MKIHWYFDSWILSFHRALTSQLPECGWSKAEESSSFCRALTSQLPEWLEQGSVSFIGEGHFLCNLNLRRFWGDNCFSGVLITETHCLLDSGVVGPRDDAYNSNSSRGCQDDRVMACSNKLTWFFLLIFNPHLISWLIGMNPIAQGMGVLSKVSHVIWQKTFPGPGGVRTSPGQLVVGGLPWAFGGLQWDNHWGWSLI